jgi:hypothetical protein
VPLIFHSAISHSLIYTEGSQVKAVMGDCSILLSIE